MKKKLARIKALPTERGSMHESLFKSYHILEIVLEMVKRGDSKETIFEVVEHLKDTENEI